MAEQLETILAWLDAVRADLDEATPGPWGVEVTDWEVSVFQHDQPDDPYAGFGRAYVCQNLTQGETEGEADARLIASAPDRLDKMERALRGVTEMHRPEPQEVNTVDGPDWIMFCRECGLEWGDDGCPTAVTAEEALGNE